LTTELRNVVVINDHATINGGQANVAIQSAIGLSRAGFNVTYFAGAGPIEPSLEEANIDVVCLGQADIASDPSRVRAIVNGVWNRDAQVRLKALLDGMDPSNTIVHCHGFAKLLSGSIGKVLTESPVRSVLTMHEYTLACPNGGFFDYAQDKICTRRPLGMSCLTTNCDSRKAIFKAWRVARQVAINQFGHMPSRLTDIIYISETQKHAMEPYLGEARLHYVANPVNFEQKPPVDVENQEHFLLIGRLSREKGCILFAEAAAKAGVKAVFVGDGEERDAIQAILPDAIITGWQSPAQVFEWFNRARCVVFPSLWYEGQPLVPLESLSRGVPLIAGTWSAASESVIDGANGVHFNNPDPDVLADALRAFSPEKAARLGQRGYEDFWKQPPTLEVHVQRLVEVYQDVLAA
jgi:glycosyltransferase involved in cell wall biosynthesis